MNKISTKLKESILKEVEKESAKTDINTAIHNATQAIKIRIENGEKNLWEATNPADQLTLSLIQDTPNL